VDPLSRRTILRLLGTSALPLNFAGCGSRFGGGLTVGSSHVPTPNQPLTPTAQFYVNHNYPQPEVPGQWALKVRGMVDMPLSLTLAELQSLPSVTRRVTQECVGNHPGGTLISAGDFTGVPLPAVLELAGVSPRARGLEVVGLDGYPSFVPIDADGVLVHTMNGAALQPIHGAPLRALFPGRYGMFNIKWLDALIPTRSAQGWMAYGDLANALDGKTAIRSRIDALLDGQTVPVNETQTLYGLAVTPGDQVAEVQIDTGAGWQQAELTYNRVGDELSPWLWTLWSTEWTPTSRGPVTVRVRAIDRAGSTQSSDPGFPYDAGAIHVVAVRVV